MPELKKVMFVTALNENIPEQSWKKAIAPSGVLSIIGYARETFPDTVFKLRDFDAEMIPLEKQLEVIKNESPQIIGMSGRSFMYPVTVNLARAVKDILPDVKIVLGGHHVSLMPEDTEYPACFDSVVVHEGEKAFLKLLKLYKNGKPWPKVLQEDYLKEITHDYAWDVIEKPGIYAKLRSPFNPDSLGSVVWSRGCPFKCVYCSGPRLWKGSSPVVRYRDTKSIINELQYMRDHFNIRRFFVHDDTPNTDIEKFRAILKALKEAELGMTWGLAGMRADRKMVPEFIFRELYDAGCRYVCFGIESGDEEVLRNIGRTVFLDDIERALTLAKKEGLRTAGGFTLGHIWLDADGNLDGEREVNLARTVDYMKKLVSKRLLWSMQLSIVDPVPGSEVWDIALKYRLIDENRDWGDILKYDRVRLNFKHPYLDMATVDKYYRMGFSLFSKNWRHILFLLSSVRSFRDLAGLVRTGIFVLSHRFSYLSDKRK